MVFITLKEERERNEKQLIAKQNVNKILFDNLLEMFSERTTVFVGGDGGDSGNAFLSLSCIEGYVRIYRYEPGGANNLKNPTTLNQVLVYLGNGNARKEFQVMATVNKLYSDTTGVKRVGGSRLIKVEFCILANIFISSMYVYMSKPFLLFISVIE
uniref:Uncharacterized protein n=1 Tax=Glossina palpalis gambiensis TaxID=67801 RepID=A0A1B0BFX3_9MUSC